MWLIYIYDYSVLNSLHIWVKWLLTAASPLRHLGRFPSLQGNTFNGPTLFITGEKQPTWESDEEVRAIKQLFPTSFFVKASIKVIIIDGNDRTFQIPGAGHWVHTEKKDDFLAAAVTFLQTEF